MDSEFLAGEVAYGDLANTIEKNGWSFLQVHTNPQYNDSTMATAAGFYEGAATADLIENFCYNEGQYNFTPTTELASFITENQAFMAQQIEAALSLPAGNPTRIYWYQVSLVLDQLSGLYAGYQSVRNNQGNVTQQMFLYLQLAGLLFTCLLYTSPSPRDGLLSRMPSSA